MANKLILVTGGCRSGKSLFAQRYVEEKPGEKIYLATCPALDAEMAKRIRRHQADREGMGWHTIEEETAIARVVTDAPANANILLDCLTLWVSNLMHQAESHDILPEEDEIAALAQHFTTACRNRDGLTVAVTNEVGLGIVPDNALARRFRDLAGRVNQAVAVAADAVFFMVSGLPVKVK